MITDLGSMTVGATVPAAVTATGFAAADASAQLTALASFSPVAILSYADQISLLNSMIANVEAAIAAGLSPPSFSAQVSAAAALSATLSARLSVLAGFQAAFASSGVDLLVYSGQRNLFGSELATALGSSPAGSNGLVLVTTNPTAWASMTAIFKTS